jgi:hypothetical protein
VGSRSLFVLCSTTYRLIESHNMDFIFGDFCLFCDRQTNGTAFCSSICRIKQLNHCTLAERTTSTASCDDINTPTVSQRLSLSVPTTGIYLPPAYDFSIHRTSSFSPIYLSSDNLKLSEEGQSDLKAYVGAFDQTRILRRRASMQTNDNS